MKRLSRTRLAILATLSDLHREPIAYDLACLRTLVAGLEPDLLCAEITRAAWEDGDLSSVGFEVRAALAPVVAATDIVLIPVAPSPEQFADYALGGASLRQAQGGLLPATARGLAALPSVAADIEAAAAPLPGWRRGLVRRFSRLLQWGQRKADRPEAIHGMAFEAFCHSVCALTEMMWTAEERAAWDAQNEALAENILQAVQRDAGRRVLVVVQCQRLHKLEPLLKRHADVLELIDYREL